MAAQVLHSAITTSRTHTYNVKEEFVSDFDDLIMAAQGWSNVARNESRKCEVSNQKDLKEELFSEIKVIRIPRNPSASVTKRTTSEDRLRKYELSKLNLEIRLKKIRKTRKKARLVDLIDRSNSLSLQLKDSDNNKKNVKDQI